MHVNPQEFGELKGAVSAIKERLDENTDKLDSILAFQQKQKGAVSVLLVLATAVSAIVGWFVSYFTK